jgi:hypothetical protein
LVPGGKQISSGSKIATVGVVDRNEKSESTKKKRTLEDAEVDIGRLVAENTKKDARITELETINHNLMRIDYFLDIATSSDNVYEIGKFAGEGVSRQAKEEIAEGRVSRSSGFLFRDLRRFSFKGALSSEYEKFKIVIEFLKGVMDGSRPTASSSSGGGAVNNGSINSSQICVARQEKSLFLIMSELMAYANQNWVSKFTIMILYTALSITKCRTLGTVISKSFGGAVDPYSLYRWIKKALKRMKVAINSTDQVFLNFDNWGMYKMHRCAYSIGENTKSVIITNAVVFMMNKDADDEGDHNIEEDGGRNAKALRYGCCWGSRKQYGYRLEYW